VATASSPRKRIIVYLVLTFGISSIFYVYMASTGSAASAALPWMWSPGIAAIITQLLFRHRFRDLGWRPGPVRYLVLGYVIPWIYGLAIYATVWVTGLGGFQPRPLVLGGSPLPFFVSLFAMALLGLLPACGSALGEEIGWRGLLVPELAKITTFGRTALLTGLVWAVWHYPAVLFAEYHSLAPRWFDLLSITVSVFGMSVFTAWLRLKTGSIWPAVLWHGNHNLLIQSVLLRMTVDTGATAYFVDDFGLGVLVSSILLGSVFWRKRCELPTTGVRPSPS
jgi:membrane protease YdiL (CAAX protease family)